MIKKIAIATSFVASLFAASACAQTAPIIWSGSISESDYPGAALRKHQQGLVTMKLTIDLRGRVSNCEVVQSSGYDELDAGSCRFWSRRFRYRPARSAENEPVVGELIQQIGWMIRQPCPPMASNGACVIID